MRHALGIALLLSLASASARAEPKGSDMAAFHRHVLKAGKLYKAEKYAEAIQELEVARAIRSDPTIDHNLAHCYERLERWDDAATTYERHAASGAQDA